MQDKWINEFMLTYKIKVLINGPRPDFRLLKSFIWSDFHNIDSDGNSFNPASRDWTELYIASRENKNEVIDINPININPLILEIKASSEILGNKAAYFLAKETSGQVMYQEETRLNDADFLLDKLGIDFNIQDALEMSKRSVWRKSSLENPYPNLKID
ncbi:hypothetical protein GXP67_28190 [Rhodocytophaga rosea]|uniref:Uncharacterized protein n=1 Tax=Rhodocytophaga rosea TaxID=2704465 RepID=A0A6C0GRM5_9BACT|nr:hypothetical protein [Rhodocytophaga rosea]QHT70253.1 hypothetical protein GXP67_28190 [Rhodocytophaga rosea]